MNILENRKNFRVKCKEPVCTQISIVKVNNKKVSTGTGKICMKDIGAGGLKFLSGLNIPVNPNMIIEFKIKVVDSVSTFYGYIVRKEEVDEGIYSYGVKFINENSENEEKIRRFYELNINGEISRPEFCHGDVRYCLQKYKHKKSKNEYNKHRNNKKLAIKMNMCISDYKDINYKWEELIINNISLEEIKFTSRYRLIGIDNKLQEFKIIASGKEIPIRGHISNRENLKDGFYIYTAKFRISEFEKKMLMQILKKELDNFNRNSIDKWKYFSNNCNKLRYNNDKFDKWA